MNLIISLLLFLSQLLPIQIEENQKFENKTQAESPFSEEVPPYSNCPVSPYPTQIVQPNNTTITIVGRGNMVNHWTETVDGYTIVLQNGIYEYAQNQNGNLTSTGVVANDPANRAAAEVSFVSTLQPSVKPALSPLKQSILSQVQNRMLNKTYPTTGNIKVLALLIDYPDLQSTFAKSNFDSLLYAANYRGGDGSFKYYFETSSDSLITVDVDVFGWYRALNGYKYYGRDSGTSRAADLVREAVDAAETAGVNFANYDNDNDNDVDGILAVHAGPGAEQGSRTEYIWSHRWVLNGGNSGSVTYDGKFINDYMINPETRIAGLNQNMVGIGVFVHEFGHNLGLPDLYDTDNTNGDSEGIGNWCLMAGGGWLGGEHRPANLSAWCRVENSWATPTPLTIGTSSGSFTMNASVNNRNEIYQVNTSLNNEYFLLENRQKIGLDVELPGEGLAIWHINTTKTNSFGNRVNADENLKGVDLEEADGNNDLDNEVNRGDNGDLFPGSSNNQGFNSISNPNSKNYLNGNTNFELRNITETGTQVSFDFGPAAVASCTGGSTFTAASGTFNDGSGTGNPYTNNLNCSWLMQVTNGPIALNFSAFDVDQAGDTLYVYDGTSNTAPLLAKLTGNSIPTTQNSTGNDLYLEFITNGSGTALGWNTNYTSNSAPIVTCTGTTNLPSAATGTFDDGSGVGANYSNNLNCSWLIDGGAANSVLAITIDSLDIESTNDSIIIYAGQNNSSAIAAIITDNSQLSLFNLNSRFAFVEFKTNGSVTANGWQMSWRASNGCSGNTTLTAVTGTFSDGTLPNVNYLDQQQCEWLIQPPGASIIKLDFNRFDTESGFDFVEVYDGATTAANRLGRFSGNNIPPTIISSGGSMLVRFTSDFSVTRTGFEVSYFSTDKDCLPSITLTSTTGSFGDGSGALNYGDNLNCGWLIQPALASNITLSFSAFNTEATNDVVNVYDGNDNTGTLLASYSGNSIPANVVLNGTNVSMFVEFVTNSSINAAGWDASYTSVIATTCSGTTTLNTASGTVVDGSGTANYDNNLNCGWLIQPPGNPSVITLNFNSVNISFGDFVRIYDGTSNAGTLIGTRTGTFIGNTLSAFSGSMFLEFITNGTITNAGWSANWNSSNTFCVPTTTLTANFGVIEDGSPFGSNYADNSDCEWLIQPTASNVAIRLTFNRFDTETTNDTVTVYNGATTSSPILGTFSGSTLPPVLTSSGGDMLVTFKSNASITATGWRAFYQTQAIPFCSGQTNLTGATGTFDDGSAAAVDYVENSNCSWLIQPSSASRIALQFNRFATSPGDAVTVYDGTSAAAPLLGSFSGTSIPPLILSNGGSLFVTFTSNGFTNDTGWEATYNSTNSQCFSNLTLTNFRDTIEDGSGTSNYDNNLNCNWLIQPPTATSITLTFTQFDLSNPGDSLKVYDGTSNTANVLGAFSGSNLPSAINSSGGSMFLEFMTDGATTAAGWKAYYDINSTLSCVGTTSLTATSGSFDDGSTSGNYDNNLNCSWLIQPSNNPAVITLNFNSMNTANFNDRVFIYDGINSSGQFLGTRFGNNTGNALNAYSGSMYIEFNTDGAQTANGWDATYSSSLSYCVPTTTFTNNFGNFTDGSPFGQNYLNNTSCQWLIQPATPNVAVRANFFNFDTEFGNDTVTVYDGATTSDPILGTYSGSSIPPITTSSGGSMLITFNTNGNTTATGWRVSYGTQAIPACSGQTNLTATSGTFDDGSAANAQYVQNSNCSWLIQPPGAISIDLNFNRFNTQLNFDFVSIYDGANNSGTLLGTFSGNTLPPTLTATSGNMFVEFTSNGFTNALGWEATYTSSSTIILDAVQDTVILNAALGSQTNITVNSNTFWISSDNSSWMLTNPINGNGSRSLSAIAIQPNIGPVRYGEVYIASTNNSIRDTVVVMQRSSGRYLIANPDTLYFAATSAGSQIASLQSNVNWNLTSPDSWITIGSASGSNDGTSQINVTTNNINVIRTGFIVVSGSLGVSNDTIFVVQDSMPAAPPALTVDPKNLSLAQASGSNSTFTVRSNVSWQTSTPAAWLSIQDPQLTMDTNTVGVTAISMNMSTTDRSSFVALQDIGGTLFDTVFVTQLGGNLILSASPRTVTLGQAQGSSASSALSSNISWIATSNDPANFDVNPNNGTGNNNLTISALTANNFTNSRASFIAIDGGNGAIRDTIFISQNGATPSLTVSPTIINLSQPINSLDSFDVFSNNGWSITVPPASWLNTDVGSTTIFGDSDVVVSAASANANATTRSTFLVVSDVLNNQFDTVFINQAGTNPILQANQDTVMLSAMMGSTANATFLSNGNWTAIEGAPWFSLSQTSGSGNGNLILTATAANATASKRYSFLALADVGNNLTDTIVVVQDTTQFSGIEANPDTLFLASTAGSIGMISMNSTEDWNAVLNASWFSLSQTSGNGTFMISVSSLSDNPSFLNRISYVAFTSINDPSITDTVVIVQAGTPISLSVNPASLILNSTAGSSDILNVTSNTGWNITNPASWISLSAGNGSNDAAITVTANSDNLSGSTRTATLTLTAAGAAPISISISQIDGTTPSFALSRDTVYVDYLQGSTNTFSVLGNQAIWRLSENAPWLLVNPAQGSNTALITVLAAGRNAFGNERSAMIVATATGFSNDTIIVIQRASTALFQAAPNAITLGPDSSNTANFNISSNLLSWTIEESSSWMIVSPDSGSFTQRIEVMATDTNRTGALRSGILTILSPPQAPLTVTVTQDTVRTIGIEELSSDVDLKIYPNPTREKVTIEGIGMDRIEIENLRLFNAMGKQVQVNFIRKSDYQIEIDLSNQAAGVYYLNVVQDQNGLSRKLILLD